GRGHRADGGKTAGRPLGRPHEGPVRSACHRRRHPGHHGARVRVGGRIRKASGRAQRSTDIVEASDVIGEETPPTGAGRTRRPGRSLKEAMVDQNLYALERQVETKLAEARAVSAHAALLSSLRAKEGSSLASLLTLIATWADRRRRHRRLRARRLP